MAVANELTARNDDEAVAFYGFTSMESVPCYIETSASVCFRKLLLLKVVLVVAAKGCVLVWRSGNRRLSLSSTQALFKTQKCKGYVRLGFLIIFEGRH